MRSFPEDKGDASSSDSPRRVVVADGGRLPISPRRFLEQSAAAAAPPRRETSYYRAEATTDQQQQRALDSDDAGYYSSYIVDKDGNEYEPYSLAWRYLGMYLDCDPQDYSDDDAYNDEGGDGDDEDEGRRRNTRERDLGGSQDGGNCERLLLWAAYVDHQYNGHSIGEYQFFDIETGDYDASTCETEWWMPWDRCKRLDCHDPNPTNFELIGVFKETDGLVDWAEQLFKHQGYCIWDSDTYESMESARERWPSYCWRLYYFYDDDGNSLYVDIQPMPEGNVTMGIYTDDLCSQVSTSITWFDYLTSYYGTYGSEEQAEEAIAGWTERITAWNDAMAPYKMCQPCRAYNRDPTSQGGSDYDGDNDRRWLGGEDDNDGEGDEEQYGYNCYDDAGYTNCNQCYKFFAKTDVELASADDLELASDTILTIRVGGVYYGSGGFRSPPTTLSYALVFTGAAMGIVLGLLIVAFYSRYRKRMRAMPQSLKEGLVVGNGGKSKSKKKKRKKKRRNNDNESSAYTEYSSSSSSSDDDDDDESRGGENFKATRLALSRSIDNVSESLKFAMTKSLDVAADLWPEQREEIVMTRSLDTAAELLPVGMTQRLDELVDYIFPMSSPEETGVESNGDSYSDQEQGDKDDETRASSRGEEGDFENQIKAGDTWIELPLKHEEEEVDVSSIEGQTSDVNNSEKSFDIPDTSQEFTDDCEQSQSYASSSPYESPDEAVLYKLPSNSASGKKATSVVDPPANQLSFASTKIDQVISDGTAEVKDVNAANRATVETARNDDEKDESLELTTSPTNETGTTAKEQKSACTGCLTVLALDSSGEQPVDERRTGAVPTLISSDACEKVQNDDPTTNAPKVAEQQSNNVDESETKSPATQSDQTKTIHSAATPKKTNTTSLWSFLALDSSSSPPDQSTGGIPTKDQSETKDVAIAEQTSSHSSANEGKALATEADAFVGDVVETETERVEQSNSAAGPVEPASESASTPTNDLASASSANDANISSTVDILIHDLVAIIDDHDSSSSNNTNEPILLNQVNSNISSNFQSPNLDPSGTYTLDSHGMLEDPSGTYTVANPSLLADQILLATASLEAPSALGATYEEEAVGEADDDNDNVSGAAFKAKNSITDVTVISNPPPNQSCNTSCWALLALEDDGHSTAAAPALTTAASGSPITTEHPTESNTSDQKVIDTAAEQKPTSTNTNEHESESHDANNDEVETDEADDVNDDAESTTTTRTRTKDPPGEPAKLVLQTTNESILNTTSHFDDATVVSAPTDEQVEEEDKDDATAQQAGGNACLEFFALD